MVLLPTQGVLSPLCYALALGFAAFVEKELVRFRNSVEKESVSFVAERPWANRCGPFGASVCRLCAICYIIPIILATTDSRPVISNKKRLPSRQPFFPNYTKTL